MAIDRQALLFETQAIAKETRSYYDRYHDGTTFGTGKSAWVWWTAILRATLLGMDGRQCGHAYGIRKTQGVAALSNTDLASLDQFDVVLAEMEARNE